MTLRTRSKVTLMTRRRNGRYYESPGAKKEVAGQ
jgi:hypothetical protein